MYPPNQSKVPPVRPRSSLSTDEHHHRIKDTHHRRHLQRNRKKPSNALLTLVGFCIFLFVLCSFLLGALVYVGRNIVDGTALLTATTNLNLTDEQGNFVYAIPDQQAELRLSTKPILRFPPPNTSHRTVPTLASAIMTSSRVSSLLSFRLPRQLQPKQYKLRLHPDLENKTFSGNVTIRLEVLQPISYIPVHAKLLNISTEVVLQLNETGDSLRTITPMFTFAHPEFEYWVTEFQDPLEVGNYSLRLSFNGSLTDRIVGFYQSSYFDAQKDEKRWIATSKFEPTYARQAFPCFDEPSMKAQFVITVVRPSGDGYHALSNMNVLSENSLGDVTEVNFVESVPMSTYLACFIVSDFSQQSKIVKGVLQGAEDFEMRVFSTAAQVNKVTYALNTGAAITEHYIEYFNISYPLPKLDMAAIPDFVSGAMEHWGLVTYRESALLYDPTISSSANKQRVATVVAHELAHMWFGNLVTMKWWNDLWLNEGFASYIEYKGVNKVHPDWDMLDQFLIADLHGVMKLDSTLASHPIVQTAESPSQITELFDSITYSKGASIIRMLEDLVGAEKFRLATTSYLNKFYFSNAETDDFFTEVEAQEFEFDVKLIMQTWTEQMGLPVVEVTKNGSNYKLTQKRFLSNPEDYEANHEVSQFNYRWSIPITYTTSSDPKEVHRGLFNYNDNEVTLTVPGNVDWIKFNKNQVGYYRVNYPADMWKDLIAALIETRSAFSNADRAHLINDVFSLADASQLEYSIALELSLYLEKELDYVPWSVGTSRLNGLKNMLYYTEHYYDFLLYGRKLVASAYESVSWNVGSDHLQNLMRVNILNLACGLGVNEASENASTRFNDWLVNPSDRPNPDIRSTVYYYGMKEKGNDVVWFEVFELMVAEEDAQEKIKLMEALAAIQEPWILRRYIEMAWDENNVRGQDYFTCLQYIAANRIGQSLVWDYVRENWTKLVERFGINERYLGRMIPSITGRFTTQTKLEEMEAFFAKYPEAGAGTAARKEALETVKYNIKWLEQNKKQVGDWLKAQNADNANQNDKRYSVKD